LGEEFRSLSSPLCMFLHSLFTSSLLVPKLSSTSYSQTPSDNIPSFLNVSDQV
jgi:hypothetical protein